MNKYDLAICSIGWFCPGVAGESQAPEQHGVWEAVESGLGLAMH